MGKSAEVVKKDFTGARGKNKKFYPRHSEAFKEAGYVWIRGKISKKD